MGGGWGVRGGFLFPGTEKNLVSHVLCEASCTSHKTFPHKPGEGGIISASRQMREWRFREAESAAQGIQTTEGKAKSKIGLGMGDRVGAPVATPRSAEKTHERREK